MSLTRVDIYIAIHGEPSAGIMPLQDHIELKWDLDEMDGERERVRNVLQEAWAQLYDDSVDVHFGDECPDCLGVGYHKPSCPSALYD